MHEHAECPLELKTLAGVLEHNTYTDWSEWASKMEQYSTIWAQDSFSRGVRISRSSAFTHSIFGFIKMYVLKLGFLDGWYGWYSCVNYFHYTQMKYLKLLELQTKN